MSLDGQQINHRIYFKFFRQDWFSHNLIVTEEIISTYFKEKISYIFNTLFLRIGEW